MAKTLEIGNCQEMPTCAVLQDGVPTANGFILAPMPPTGFGDDNIPEVSPVPES